VKFFRKIQAVFPKDWPTRIILSVIILAAVVGAVYAFRLVGDLVASTTAFTLPGDPVLLISEESQTQSGEDVESTDEPEINLPDPDPWDGTSRVNVLVMGLDLRDTEDESAAPRSDTMILLTMDPLNNTAGAIAIPRDMWAAVPGFGHYKINTAYRLGELYKIPGGGPALASQTVEEFLGVPIHFYVQIDFQAFVDFIDHIHGIKVTFDEPYTVDRRGPKNTVTLEPGTYVLDGEYALAYARDRKSEGDDFDRSSRQMEVILLIRQRILNFDQLPTLVMNAPAIYEDLSTGIRTNMSLDQIIQLAWKAREIPKENIQMVVISPEYITIEKSPDGLDILKPIPDKIRLLRDEIFGNGGLLAPAAGDDSLSLAVEEGAYIRVLNGSYQPDLGTKTAAWLVEQGLNAVAEGNVESTTVSSVTLQGEAPYALRWLAETFEMTVGRITHDYIPDAIADLVLILGDDWASNNPMP
jgi:polyisoprenyl-teichoic acid--peptidoglycan teichoic acid transferase